VGYEFFTSFVFYLFCAAKQLTAIFLRKRFPDFSAKKKFLFWGCYRYTLINICPPPASNLFASKAGKKGFPSKRAQPFIFGSLLNNTTTATFFLIRDISCN
jgi:hypothetical protein